MSSMIYDVDEGEWVVVIQTPDALCAHLFVEHDGGWHRVADDALTQRQREKIQDCEERFEETETAAVT